MLHDSYRLKNCVSKAQALRAANDRVIRLQ